MQFIFDADVAEEIGLNGAIILNNIAYWVGRNAANGINFHDGCYWTFNSLEAFQKMFHFWSERTIQRTLHSLEDGGYIQSGCYNKDPRDLTKWYTVTEKGWKILPVSDVTKAKHGHGQAVKEALSTCQGAPCQSAKPTNIQNKLAKDTTKKNTRAGAREGEEPAAPSSPSRTRRTSHVSCPFFNPSPELVAAWVGFEEMRRSIKKPLTQRAADLIAKKVQQLAPGDERKQAAILDQSVAGGWQGVYPLKTGEGVRGGKGYAQTQTVEEMYEEAQEILKNGGGII